MSDDYIYAVARVRARELSLLNRQDMDQLLSCKTYEDCLRVLHDKGWGSGGETSAEALLAAEEEKTWALIRELTPDLSSFETLLYPTDFNNLKAAVKCVVTNVEPVNVFLPGGTVEPETMMKCVRENDFSALPPAMAQAADEAYHTLLQTGDGQLCDVILDRACLAGILEQGKSGKNETLAQYAELLAAVSNIKVAVRACKTQKSREFLDAALVPCATLDTAALAGAACKSLTDVFAYLSATAYSEAGERLKESYSAFEKWCDDKIMALVKGQKSDYFTVGPLFAYVLARRSEISSVRVILSGKLNELDDGMIRERVRDTYV